MGVAVLVVAAPGPLVDVRPAQVSAGAGEELVLSTVRPAPTGPDGRTLTVVRFGATAAEVERSSLDLSAEAAWWDAGHGLWLLDGRGLLRLPARTRIAALETPLAWMGPTTPAQAGLVVDLDRDSRAELLVWAGGAVHGFGEDGTSWGSIPAPAAGSLSATAALGGQAMSATVQAPPVAVADVDGDGVEDVLVIHPDTVAAFLSGPGTLGQRTQRWPLPPILAASQADAEAGWTIGARWADLTGDGRADLLASRVDSSGGMAATEAELQLWVGTGTGSGLAAPQVVRTGAGSIEVFPVDLDGDGDLDVLVPQVRIDVGALAQAVLSQSFDAELVAYPMEDGRLGSPRPMHRVRVSLDGEQAAWSLFEDLSGDGRPDLAYITDQRLQCFAALPDRIGLADMPWVDVPVPFGVDNLWSVDLTGDGVAELVGWSPGESRLLVVRL